MAEKQQYTVVHPVRHNGKLHQRTGTLLGDGKIAGTITLSDEDAGRLLDRGVISTAAPATVVQVIAGPSTAETLASLNKLNAMTKEALLEYGQATYGLTLSGDDKKEALVSAIHDKYVLTLTPAVV